MGFLDKIKSTVDKVKEDNKNFGKTTKRMNVGEIFGHVNKNSETEDFSRGSYVNLENGKFVIYNTKDDDYFFSKEDIKVKECLGVGPTIKKGKESFLTQKYKMVFTDNKEVVVYIFSNKIEKFNELCN